MRKLYFISAVMVAVVTVFSGCAIFSLTETVDFSMETEALCRNAGGDFQGIELFCVSSPEIESHIRVQADCREFPFSLPKNYVSAVLAYPVVDGFRKRPLGAVYPYSCKLDVTGGFVAEVLARVYRLAEGSGVQDYLSRFNWQRLYDECAVYEDPWVLDMDRIVKAIAKGSFRKSDLKTER
ncbi:MAG: hypothetical protein J6W60_05840 [Treponema sp.]|nr:hypothetical protein [Treponema sp.]